MKSSSTGPQPIGLSSAMAALFISVLWGGNIVALKIGLFTVPPLWSAVWRFVLATLTVGVFAKLSGVRLNLDPRDARQFGALGFLFASQIAAQNIGLTFTSPAYGIILLNSYPIFTNVVSHFFVAHDRLSRQRIAGLVIAFLGISYLALGRPAASLAPRPIVGNLLILLSAVLLALVTVYAQRLVQTREPTRVVFWQMLFSVLFFVASAIPLEPLLLRPLTALPVAAITYQGVMVGGVCFIIWTRLLQRHTPGSVSVFSFTVPIFGVLASAYFFDEAITARLLLGVVAVTIGILIVTRSKQSGEQGQVAPTLEEAVEEAASR